MGQRHPHHRPNSSGFCSVWYEEPVSPRPVCTTYFQLWLLNGATSSPRAHHFNLDLPPPGLQFLPPNLEWPWDVLRCLLPGPRIVCVSFLSL